MPEVCHYSLWVALQWLPTVNIGLCIAYVTHGGLVPLFCVNLLSQLAAIVLFWTDLKATVQRLNEDVQEDRKIIYQILDRYHTILEREPHNNDEDDFLPADTLPNARLCHEEMNEELLERLKLPLPTQTDGEMNKKVLKYLQDEIRPYFDTIPGRSLSKGNASVGRGLQFTDDYYCYSFVH